MTKIESLTARPFKAATLAMNKTLFLFLILACSAAAFPQEKSTNTSVLPNAQSHCSVPSDEDSIRQIAEQWKDGYNYGHAAAVASLYSEDATYLTQHFVTGIVQGRAAIQAYVQRGVDAGYHIDSIDVLSLDCSEDLAYTSGRYHSTNAGQKALGVNIVVLKKIGGRWLIVAARVRGARSRHGDPALDSKSGH